jgi:hypothetical protein
MPLSSTVYELSNPDCANPLPLSTIAYSPIPRSIGRAFHYFVHRSSVDLAGPHHVQVWQSYVLGRSTRSPPIQHAVAALSGFHERQYFSDICSLTDAREDWRRYYLAVKHTNALVSAAQENETDSFVAREEILIACTIFITIELLLGNLEAAVRHLEGGFSLIQACLSASCVVTPGTRTGTTQVSPPYLDARLSDLIGFFARLDLQMLSFLPPARYSASEPPMHPPAFAVSQTCRPLPITLSAQLYRIVKRSLHWIRDHASTAKYSSCIASKLFEARASLVDDLEQWRTAFKNGERELGDVEGDNMLPETAQLLLTYHIMSLKLRTALSASERVFSNPECLGSFRAILEYASTIIRQRSQNQGRTLFVTLDTSTCEPLYYTAIKCREPSLRRRALELLKLAGGEGVWDGDAMAVIGRHVIDLEEWPTAGTLCQAADGTAVYRNLQHHLERTHKFLLKDNIRSMPSSKRDSALACHDNLISEVLFEVDRKEKWVEVSCGWFSDVTGCWKHEKRMLKW